MTTNLKVRKSNSAYVITFSQFFRNSVFLTLANANTELKPIWIHTILS